MLHDSHPCATNEGLRFFIGLSSLLSYRRAITISFRAALVRIVNPFIHRKYYPYIHLGMELNARQNKESISRRIKNPTLITAMDH